MSRNNKADEAARLRALRDQLEEEKVRQEKEGRKSKFPALMQLAITAMRSSRERTWLLKQGSGDAAKKAEADKKVKADNEAFVKAFRQIVRNDLKRWWAAELQAAYIKGAPEALLTYYLSDNPAKTKPLAYALKKAGDDYVRGWELLGKKKREEMPGPIEVKGNGALAVQILIEQLSEGDDIQKTQAKILEIVFKDPIEALGQKPSESTGFTLGDTLSADEKEGHAK